MSNWRYHFCQWCGKFMLRKSAFCKKCNEKWDNLTEYEKKGFFAPDYDPIEWDEMNGVF